MLLLDWAVKRYGAPKQIFLIRVHSLSLKGEKCLPLMFIVMNLELSILLLAYIDHLPAAKLKLSIRHTSVNSTCSRSTDLHRLL
jgi:hypothetical protein